MDVWENFNETSLPEKDDFSSKLNMKRVTDLDHNHAKRICNDFETRKLGEYHNLYLSDTLLLADLFENFRKMW